MKKLGHSFGQVSGHSARDCHYLAYRFVEEWGFKPDAGESWLIRMNGDTQQLLLHKPGWMTSLWRSPGGQVFVTDASGQVYRYPAGLPDQAAYAVDDVRATLMGVWGLDDDFVWAWGVRGGGPVLFRWDGSHWHEESAPGYIIAIHGARRDLCVAVGELGLVAVWNGRSWARMESLTPTTLSSVFVASEDEFYASGVRGDLLARTIYGWRKVLTHDSGHGGIVKWKGDVWVGAGGPLGLSRLVDGALESAKPNLLGAGLEARDELVVSTGDVIASTADGTNYLGYRLSGFVEIAATQDPSW